MLRLPPTCDDLDCRIADRTERDQAAIADAITRGVIDP